jgi:hypothetical protein
VKIRGSASALVYLDIGSGNIGGSRKPEFNISDAAYGRLMLMDGNASVEKLPMGRRLSGPGSPPMAQSGPRGWHTATSRIL